MLAISRRFAQLHAISLRFAQIHKISFSLIQIHAIQIDSNPFSCAQIHTDSHSFTPDSFYPPRTQPEARRFGQASSDLFEFSQIRGLIQIHSDPLSFPQIDADPSRFAHTHLNYIDKS